jgi:hypothetical protein
MKTETLDFYFDEAVSTAESIEEMHQLMAEKINQLNQ